MKRFLFIACIYVCFLIIPIHGNSGDLHYRIYASSQGEALIVLKKEVLSILNNLFEGVDESSYVDLLEENLNVFEECKTYLKGDTLYLVYGDGKGKVLRGTYEKENICYPEVKPKSIFKEWWKNVMD